jgi:hypothetical protein
MARTNRTNPPASSEPACGQPLPDGGKCCRVAGHMGRCY